MSSCIIIGAGMAGLTAARELTRHKWQVTVLDKGRGVGGRMATRRIHKTRADHGAQYFSARTPEFQAQVQAMRDAGVVTEWYLPGIDTHPRYIGVSGMSAIAKYLAVGLTIHTEEKVVQVEGDATGCTVRTEAGRVYSADRLIITIPAPQVKALLADSGIQLAAPDQSALDAISYQPCLAVIAVLNRPSRIPAPGGMKYQDGPISWIADNQQKGVTDEEPSVTIHASPQYSRERLEDDLSDVGEDLLDELHEWISTEEVGSFQVHRWRYSLCDQRYPGPYLWCRTPFPLLLGGDGFGMGNVEGAFQSGLQMARALVEET